MREEREDEIISENNQVTIGLIQLLCSVFNPIGKKTARKQYENGNGRGKVSS